jgi:hypothetical protein
MFPVKFKSKIPHTESYPLKAGEVSAALTGVPQEDFLKISFWHFVQMRDRNRRVLPLVTVAYSRWHVDLTTSSDWISEGWLDPTWEISISAVPRTLRHFINSLLVSEALPHLRNWLEARKDLHGRFGRDGIRVVFDKQMEKLQYERTE